jgi:hypothetical protein
MRCQHCGEDTFTISGWSDLDCCAGCGRPLGRRDIELDAALKAKGRFSRYAAAGDSGSRAAESLQAEGTPTTSTTKEE